MKKAHFQRKIMPKKKLGQNFITDTYVLNKELKYAQIKNTDIVLEIGPGTGNLTELLAKQAKKVIAIEKDSQFKTCLLNLQKKYKNIDLIWGDALKVKFPKFDKVVANLPFGISLPLTFKLLDYDFELAILIYQQKQAERMCASVSQKGYCRLGVQISRKADLKILETISRTAFYPVPDVDSALVSIKKTANKFEIPSDDFFKALLTHLFENRDHTIYQALFNFRYKDVSRPKLVKAMEMMSIKLTKKLVYQASPKQLSKIAWTLWDILKN